MAQAHMGALYNRDNFDLINNYTYGACFPSLNMGYIIIPPS